MDNHIEVEVLKIEEFLQQTASRAQLIDGIVKFNEWLRIEFMNETDPDKRMALDLVRRNWGRILLLIDK